MKLLRKFTKMQNFIEKVDLISQESKLRQMLIQTKESLQQMMRLKNILNILRPISKYNIKQRRMIHLLLKLKKKNLTMYQNNSANCTIFQFPYLGIIWLMLKIMKTQDIKDS